MTQIRSLAFVLGASLAALVAAVLIAGANPITALSALVRGSVGDGYALATTWVRATPLVVTGLAVVVAFRVGVLNIGAEGQFWMGSLGAAAVGVHLGGVSGWIAVPLCLLTGALAGGGWGGIAGLLRVGRGVPEVLSTILLNFVALALVGWAVNGPMQEAARRYPQSDPLALAARLPRLPGTQLHLGILLALLLAGLVWLLLFRTALGLRLRAVGLNPTAAKSAGVPVGRSLVGTLVASGALAGLAGAVEVMGPLGRLYADGSTGVGYTAIAVALLARLDPLAAIPAALFFGGLDAGAGAMQREAGVPAVLVSVVQAVVIVAALIAAKRKSD